MTHRQAEILSYIKTFARTHGRTPTIREIGRALGISSTSVVNHHLKRLAREGKLDRRELVARGISIPDAALVIPGDRVRVELDDGRQVVGRFARAAVA